MKKIIVLGAGLVGRVMTEDLAKDYEVTSIDISQENLDNINAENIKKICADISDSESLKEYIKDCDLVIGAVPGFMGYKMMRDVIEAKKNIISHMKVEVPTFKNNNLPQYLKSIPITIPGSRFIK